MVVYVLSYPQPVPLVALDQTSNVTFAESTYEPLLRVNMVDQV